MTRKASTLPSLPDVGKLQPLKPLRRHPVRFTGPKLLHLQKDPAIIGGPGDPPEGFIGAHNSVSEWEFYWAMARVTKSPKDPRKPPFVGGIDWEYQKPVGGGRIVGGEVVDFVYVSARNKTIGIRVQTERFHIMTDAAKQMSDFFLKVETKGVDQVVDVFDADWIGDKTGRAICIVAANAIKGITRYSPIIAGTAQRIRP